MSAGPAFIAGLGASAGGLEALIALARGLPRETGGAYVVAQHTAPTHRSLLGELLARRAALPVRELDATPTAPQPDVIHVTPAGADVDYVGGLLRLAPPCVEPGAPKPSIDRLFRSLAAEAGMRAVGVLLSGTGSDGVEGLRAIHDAGGLTVAQEPATAKYAAMPEAALRTGCVDVMLDPERIGAMFGQATGRDYAPGLLRAAGESETAMAGLIAALKAARGVDFSLYKPAMIRRRVARRMQALECDDLDAYAARALASPEEQALLFEALLISVTSFFRDPEEFEALRPELARLVGTNTEAPLEVWAPGCATGEEVWTLATMIAEIAGGIGPFRKRDVRIIGTDIDEAALRRACAARHSPEAIAAAPPTLGRFFRRDGDRFAPHPALREATRFLRHDLLSAPPPCEAALISCRNLLIYLTERAQAQALGAMRGALRPGGALFLGKAETTAAAPGAFAPVGGSPRILRPARPDAAPVPPTPPIPARSVREPSAFDAATERALFESLASSLGEGWVLVDDEMWLVRRHGATEALLTPGAGEGASLLGGALARRWRREGPDLVRRAFRAGVRQSGAPRCAIGEGSASVVFEALEATPLPAGPGRRGMALLMARRWSAEPGSALAPGARAPGAANGEPTDSRGRAPEALGAHRALAVELQVANDTLQATAQELQTANEELQASNEELTTVNEELQLRSQQLDESAAHLRAVLQRIASPVLVVDARLRVSDASLAACDLLGLGEAALAERRDLTEIAAPPGFPPLAPLFREALARGEAVSREIDTHDAAWSMSVAPFRDGEGGAAGAVAVFADQTERRSREARLREAMERLEASNAELERFSYVASHDLKEPVRTLAGFAECLDDPDLALTRAERAALLASIRDNALRLGEIIDSLLAFSRIDREVQIERVDLAQAAREATEFLSRAASDCGARIEIGRLPTVRASRVHMRQLFQNLIGNALKFRRAPAPRVRVGAQRVGRSHEIWVEDDGPGVPVAGRQVIFEVFRRLQPRGEVEGAGLGLSICRKIVTQYGGRIWCAESDLGGAAFRFTLPVA